MVLTVVSVRGIVWPSVCVLRSLLSMSSCSGFVVGWLFRCCLGVVTVVTGVCIGPFRRVAGWVVLKVLWKLMMMWCVTCVRIWPARFGMWPRLRMTNGMLSSCVVRLFGLVVKLLNDIVVCGCRAWI